MIDLSTCPYCHETLCINELEDAISTSPLIMDLKHPEHPTIQYRGTTEYYDTGEGRRYECANCCINLPAEYADYIHALLLEAPAYGS